MSKNYFVVATIPSLAIVAGVLGYGSTANAWGGPHHAQGEYRHTATRGAYVTSAPQHLHHNSDPNCPYYSAVEGQTSQSQATSQPAQDQAETQAANQSQGTSKHTSYNGYSYGWHSGNGRHHGNCGNGYFHSTHHANCENCPYAAQ